MKEISNQLLQIIVMWFKSWNHWNVDFTSSMLVCTIQTSLHISNKNIPKIFAKAKEIAARWMKVFKFLFLFYPKKGKFCEEKIEKTMLHFLLFLFQNWFLSHFLQFGVI